MIQKHSKNWFGGFLIFFFILCYSSLVHAGEGKFHPPEWNNKSTYDIKKSGRLDMHVFLDRAMDSSVWTEAKLKTYFNRISQELYDATEKQVQLGKIKIYRGKPGAEKKSDLLFSPNISGAYTYASKFGDPSSLGKIYSAPKYLSSSSRPVVVHELGHLLFGMYDSYVGWLEDPNNQSRNVHPNSAKDGWEWKNSLYYWHNATKGALPRTSNDARNSPDFTTLFYDNTTKYDGSVCCIMDGPDTGETEFSTPVSNTTSWVTEHIPIRKNIDVTWYTAPDKSGIAPPFTTKINVVTKQNKRNNEESSWETIVRNHSEMAIPTSEPQSGDTAGHIKFDDNDSDDVELIIMDDINQIGVVIDRSGSMSGSRINLAKTAASLVVELTHEQEQATINGETVDIMGDYLSVTSFSTSSTLNYAPGGEVAEMTTTNKAAAQNAISQISATGSTSIGAGLQTSFGTLARSDAPKNIIVLSDGKENSSPYISQVENDLINGDVRVYSVALGTGADSSKLRTLAEKTKGEFFFASNETQLSGIFAQIYTLMRDEGSIRTQGGVANSNSSANIMASDEGGSRILGQRNIISPITRLDIAPDALEDPDDNQPMPGGPKYESVEVNDSVVEATFLVSWDYGTANIQLIDPSGNTITPYDADLNQDISYAEDTGYALYRIKNIESGSWVVNMDFTDNNVQWELRVSSIDDAIKCTSSSKQGEYSYGDAIIIQASCNAPEPVIGGKAWAVVVGPDGKESALMLHDNGNSGDGDQFKDDGLYSAVFSATGGNGHYTVTSVFNSEGATTSDGSSPGIEVVDGTILIPKPVTEFQRYNQFTFSLSGSPSATQDSDFDGMPDLWEQANGLNANNPGDAGVDNDGDTLTNLQEFTSSTDPNKKDTDGDGYDDATELQKGSDPLDINSIPLNIPALTSFPWQMMLSSINARQLQNKPAPSWGVDNDVCCGAGPYSFYVSDGSTQKISTNATCSSTSTWNGWVVSDPGLKQFTWSTSGATCRQYSGSFSHDMKRGYRYLFEAKWTGSTIEISVKETENKESQSNVGNDSAISSKLLEVIPVGSAHGGLNQAKEKE